MSIFIISLFPYCRYRFFFQSEMVNILTLFDLSKLDSTRMDCVHAVVFDALIFDLMFECSENAHIDMIEFM